MQQQDFSLFCSLSFLKNFKPIFSNFQKQIFQNVLLIGKSILTEFTRVKKRQKKGIWTIAIARKILDFSGIIKFKTKKIFFMAQQNTLSANIPYKTLIDLHKNYLLQKQKILSGVILKEETQSIWFKLDAVMRKFLNEVLSDPDVSGIRMYILQYPASQIYMDGEKIPQNPLDVNQMSIGIVTTRQEGTKHPDYPTSSSGIEMLVAPPLNHGALCPQQCNQ
jgi:hypothetical protein